MELLHAQKLFYKHHNPIHSKGEMRYETEDVDRRGSLLLLRSCHRVHKKDNKSRYNTGTGTAGKRTGA